MAIDLSPLERLARACDWWASKPVKRRGQEAMMPAAPMARALRAFVAENSEPEPEPEPYLTDWQLAGILRERDWCDRKRRCDGLDPTCQCYIEAKKILKRLEKLWHG